MNMPLVDRLAANLDGSFEMLVREHQDRLFGLAYRYTGSAPDAEELAQDAFVRAYRALEGYEPERIRSLQLRAWLTTILLNLCRNFLARPAHRATTGGIPIDESHAIADHRLEPERHVDRAEAAGRWAALVGSLPPRYRAAVLLRHLDGMSYEEMAQVLGRPEGTLKAQVHRGVALLRAAFEADERGQAAVYGAGAPDSRVALSRAVRPSPVVEVSR
jgi:RNA polymerase sigma-70 factor (ECF subfamily)